MATNTIETVLKVTVEKIGSGFENLERSAQQAFDKISSGVGGVTASLNRLPPSLAAVQAGFDRFGHSLQGLGGSLVGLGTGLNNLGAAAQSTVTRLGLLSAAATAAGTGFLALVKNAADAADNIGEMTAGLGTTTDKFQGLALVAADSGISMDKFARAMGNFSKVIEKDTADAFEKAKKKIEEFGEVFPATTAGMEAYEKRVAQVAKSILDTETAADRAKRPLASLGVEVRNAAGGFRDSFDIFLDTVAALNKMADGVEKTNKLFELFGTKGGRAFADFIGKGVEGIKEMVAALKSLQFTADEINIGDKVARQFLVLEIALERMRQRLLLAFGPSVGAAIEEFSKLIIGNLDHLVETVKILVEENFKPIMEDLARLLKGEEVETDFVKNMIANFKALGVAAKGAWEIIKFVFDALKQGADQVATTLNNMFGTNLTGGALLISGVILQVIGAFRLLGTAATAAALVVVVAFRSIMTAATLLRAAFLALGAGLLIPTAPLALALGLIAALLLSNSEKFKAIWKTLWEEMKTITSDGIKALWEAIKSDLDFQPTDTFVTFLKRKVEEELAAMYENVKTVISNIHKLLSSGIPTSIPEMLVQAFTGKNIFGVLKQQFDDTVAEIERSAKDGKIGKAVEDSAKTSGNPFQDLVDKWLDASARGKEAQLAAAADAAAGTIAEQKKIQSEIDITGMKWISIWKGGKEEKFLVRTDEAMKNVDSLGREVMRTVEIIRNGSREKFDVLTQEGQDKVNSLGREVTKVVELIRNGSREKMTIITDDAKAKLDELGLKIAAIDEKMKALRAEQETQGGKEAELNALAEQRKAIAAEELALQQRITSELGKQSMVPLPKPRPPEAGPTGQGDLASQLGAAALDAALAAVATDITAFGTSLTTTSTTNLPAFVTALQSPTTNLTTFGTALQTTATSMGTIDERIAESAARLAESGPALTEALKAAGDTLAAELAAMGQQVSTPLTAVGTAAATAAPQIGVLGTATATAAAAITSAAAAISAAASAASASAAAAAASASAAAAAAAKPPGSARGGYIRGPGTSTSDSILARLSNREYVHRAMAVSKYGVPFMNAVNSLRIPIDAVRALMGRGFKGGGLAIRSPVARLPRFNVGGLASGLASALAPPRFDLPAFADGGSPGRGRAATVNFQVNGAPVGSIRGTDQTVKDLQRITAHQKIARASNPGFRTS